MIDLPPMRARFASLSPHLDERDRPLLAATDARLAGYGGIAKVARATGVAATTIGRSLRDPRGRKNWRPTPLVSYPVIVDLITATTRSGLTVRRELDPALSEGHHLVR